VAAWPMMSPIALTAARYERNIRVPDGRPPRLVSNLRSGKKILSHHQPNIEQLFVPTNAEGG
jgi:hypothetical protein